MELIIVFMLVAFFKFLKPILDSQAVQPEQKQKDVTYQMPKQATRTTSARAQVQQQNTEWQRAAQENIAKAKQRAAEKLREFERDVITEMHSATSEQMDQKPTNRSAMQQVHEGRMEARNTSILQRAVANADEDKVDVTLETMEAEHNHSERVSAAVHHHPEDTLSDNMLGTVEDLMVIGFDGNLCFERDFVGEGLDMISRFSYQ